MKYENTCCHLDSNEIPPVDWCEKLARNEIIIIIKRLDELEIKGRAETIQTTALLRSVGILRKSPGDLRRLAVTQTPVKFFLCFSLNSIRAAFILRLIALKRRISSLEIIFKKVIKKFLVRPRRQCSTRKLLHTFLWTPTHRRASVGRPARTYLQ